MVKKETIRFELLVVQKRRMPEMSININMVAYVRPKCLRTNEGRGREQEKAVELKKETRHDCICHEAGKLKRHHIRSPQNRDEPRHFVTRNVSAADVFFEIFTKGVGDFEWQKSTRLNWNVTIAHTL